MRSRDSKLKFIRD